MAEHGYEAGLRDGKIEALEKMQQVQNVRIDNHEKRLAIAERILYAMMGFVAFIELFPKLSILLGL